MSTGLQKADGIIGSLVVREPKDHDPNWYVYDEDLPSHVVLVQDWLYDGGDERFPGFARSRIGQNPNTYLINGKGLLFVRKFIITIFMFIYFYIC